MSNNVHQSVFPSKLQFKQGDDILSFNSFLSLQSKEYGEMSPLESEKNWPITRADMNTVCYFGIAGQN